MSSPRAQNNGGPSAPRGLLPRVAFDWGGPKGVTATFDGATVMWSPSTLTLLESLGEPHLVVTEATFESYSRDSRRAVMEAARDAGHILRVVPPRSVYRARKKAELDHTDDNDVRLIWQLAFEQPRRPLRRPSWPRKGPETEAERWNRTRRMYAFRFGTLEASTVLSVLPPYDEQSAEFKTAFGDGKQYSLPFMRDFVLAVEASRESRRAFQRRVGLWDGGYPSYFRSTFQRRNWLSRKRCYRVQPAVFQRLVRGLYHTVNTQLDCPGHVPADLTDSQRKHTAEDQFYSQAPGPRSESACL